MSVIRVCSFESRRADEMRSLIERQGASAFVAPSMREVRLESNTEVFAFVESLFADKIDVVVFLTGVGARAVLEAVQTRFDRDAFLVSRLQSPDDRFVPQTRRGKPRA